MDVIIHVLEGTCALVDHDTNGIHWTCGSICPACVHHIILLRDLWGAEDRLSNNESWVQLLQLLRKGVHVWARLASFAIQVNTINAIISLPLDDFFCHSFSCCR